MKLQPQSTPFDAIRQMRPDGTEFWSARSLMPLLGYPRWQEFKAVLDRASISCDVQGQNPTDHFSGLTLKTPTGRPSEDIQLSRFGAYLLAMNGDPSKPEIAAAQGYFVVKTREAELKVQTPLSSFAMIAALATQADQLEQRTSALEAHNLILTAKVETITSNSGWFTVKAWASLRSLSMPNEQAKTIGKKCAALCRERGITPQLARKQIRMSSKEKPTRQGGEGNRYLNVNTII
jgi:DNA-damage-inducible protein D